MRKFIAFRHACIIASVASCAGPCWTSTASAVGVQIKAAPDHAVLLKADGTVWQWGVMAYSQTNTAVGCQIDVAVTSDCPVKIPGMAQITAIAAIDRVTIALKNDGTVWGWGVDPSLHYSDCPSPSGTLFDTVWQVKDPSDESGLLTGVTGIWGRNGSLFARKSDGSVWAWGNNDENKLGVKAPPVNRAMPHAPQNIYSPLRVRMLATPIDGNQFPLEVTAGLNHGLALQADGHIRAWGGDGYGERGDLAYEHNGDPSWDGHSWTDHSTLTDLSNVRSLVAGPRNSLATTADGGAYVWGLNYYVDLGNAIPSDIMACQVFVDPTCITSNKPLPVFNWPPTVRAVAVARGEEHSIFLASDGNVRGLGYNGYHQLGTASAPMSHAYDPYLVPGIGNITAIDAANRYNVALQSDGTVWIWGYFVSTMYSSATRVTIANPVATAGICGIAHGQSFDGAPTDSLCVIGNASAVAGSGPWTWQCTLNGSSSNCTANRGVSILIEPADARAIKGNSVSFSVLAQGSGTLQYQWYKATSSGGAKLVNRRPLNTGANCWPGIAGTTTPTLTLSALCGNEAGAYYVIVTNPNGGSLTSRMAQLNYLVASAREPISIAPR